MFEFLLAAGLLVPVVTLVAVLLGALSDEGN